MMPVYKVLSILLEYPGKELTAYWDDLIHLLAGQPNLSADDEKIFSEFIGWASALSLTKLQTKYVDTFDMTSAHSLYLTYHLFDEQDRDRGPALVELSEIYKKTGFEISDGELPDYLPLILEYVSTMDNENSARQFLLQTAQAVDIIATNLEKNSNPYAPLVRMIERHGRLADIAA